MFSLGTKLLNLPLMDTALHLFSHLPFIARQRLAMAEY